ncbi:MAG: IclR family transcriptional regulator [Actinomycetota bacterium]|nr:IclR family transcriptional regulator [Actinomycetota bacterium]
MSTVQSIDRAFAVLRTLASGPAGVTEIAERVGLPKSTVSRLLSTLEELGAVEQESAGGDYRTGAAMIELAAAAQPGRSLISIARPHLAELTRLTGEAAGVSIPDGLEMFYIDQLTPNSELQVRDWTGTRIPMHAVPSGQVVLATDAELLHRLVARRLVPFTAHTLTTAAALRARIAEVQREGYAWAFEEFADGLNSVAAAVHNTAGKVVAAVHVYGPASRFPGHHDPAELGRMVRATAAKIRID